MEKLIRRVNVNKNNKRSLCGFIKCFVNNEKSKELFKSSGTFSDVKTFITTKKVS